MATVKKAKIKEFKLNSMPGRKAAATSTKRKTTTKVAAKISGAGKAIPKKAKAPAKKKAVAPKKKLGNAKPKVKMTKVAKATGDNWFAKLSKKAQAEYVKTHPNSKYAKGAKVSKTAVKAKAGKTGAKEKQAARMDAKAILKGAKAHAKITQKAVIATTNALKKALKAKAAHAIKRAKAKSSGKKAPAKKADHSANVKAARAKMNEAKATHKSASKTLKTLGGKKTPTLSRITVVSRTVAKINAKKRADAKKKAPSARSARASTIGKVPGRSKAKNSK